MTFALLLALATWGYGQHAPHCEELRALKGVNPTLGIIALPRPIASVAPDPGCQQLAVGRFPSRRLPDEVTEARQGARHTQGSVPNQLLGVVANGAEQALDGESGNTGETLYLPEFGEQAVKAKKP